MKTFPLFATTVLSLIVLLLPLHTHATICSGSIVTWPHNSLPINGRIVVTGSLEYEGVVESLSKQHPRLVSTTHTVSLVVGQINRSPASVTQAILIPSEPLRNSTVYRLEIDSNVWLYKSGSFLDTDSSEFIWTTTDRRDEVNPIWGKNPMGIRAETDGWFGYFFVLETQIDDEQPYAVEVELTAAGQDTQRFIITYFRHDEATELYQFGIGQSYCAGTFSVREGDQYRARFTAIDVAGNRTLCSQSCVLVFAGERIEEDEDEGDWYSTSISQKDCIEVP